MLQRATCFRSDTIWYGAFMMNRRQVLQSFSSIATASVFARVATATGMVSEVNQSVRPLAELLQDTIELCRSSHSEWRQVRATVPASLDRQCVRSGQLCEIALGRLRQSSDRSPAFWQACADSVARLQAMILHSTAGGDRSWTDVTETLRQLRSCLASQTVLAIEGRILRA